MFNGRHRVQQLATVIIVLYLILAIAISLFGRNLARDNELALNIFSHQSGPFRWGYEFSDGEVGPFVVGTNVRELRATLQKVSGIKVVLPSNAQEGSDGFVDPETIPNDVTDIYTTVPCAGSRCVYNFTLKNGVVTRIWKGHSLLLGL